MVAFSPESFFQNLYSPDGTSQVHIEKCRKTFDSRLVWKSRTFGTIGVKNVMTKSSTLKITSRADRHRTSGDWKIQTIPELMKFLKEEDEAQVSCLTNKGRHQPWKLSSCSTHTPHDARRLDLNQIANHAVLLSNQSAAKKPARNKIAVSETRSCGICVTNVLPSVEQSSVKSYECGKLTGQSFQASRRAGIDTPWLGWKP